MTWRAAVRLTFATTWLLVAVIFSFERGTPRGRPPRPEQPSDQASWKFALWLCLCLLSLSAVFGIVMLIRGG